MMHPVDRAAALFFRYGPASLKVFSDGWGDEALIELLAVTGDAAPPPPIEISWDAERRAADGLMERDGAFLSPVAELPAASRTAAIRMISPADRTRRLVVMMAAWNDHGFRTRDGLARRLATFGVSSIMLENPFFDLFSAYPITA